MEIKKSATESKKLLDTTTELKSEKYEQMKKMEQHNKKLFDDNRGLAQMVEALRSSERSRFSSSTEQTQLDLTLLKNEIATKDQQIIQLRENEARLKTQLINV